MSVFVLAYMSVALLWASMLLKVHASMRRLSELHGERTAVVVALISGLVWPIEMIGLIGYFALAAYSTAMYYLRKTSKSTHRPDAPLESGLICHNCGSEHRWLGSVEAMYEIGWQLVKDSVDPSHVYWFCSQCEPFEPRPNDWKERKTWQPKN